MNGEICGATDGDADAQAGPGDTSRVLRLSGVTHRELRSLRTGECFSLSADLSERLGLKDLFIHHEIIPPGRRASGAHSHSVREEAALVLEGRVVAWAGERKLELQAGEMIAFPPGESHGMANEGVAEAKVLVITTRAPGDRVTYGDS